MMTPLNTKAKKMVLLPNYVLFPLIGFGWGVTHALYSGGKPKDTQMMEGAMGWAVVVGYGLVGMAAGTLLSWIF